MSPGPSMSCKGSLGIHGVQWPEYGDGARASLEYGKKKKKEKRKCLTHLTLALDSMA